MEKIRFEQFQNCLRLTNNEIEVVISVEFGPRILAYNFVGGDNVLGIHGDKTISTALGDFRIYGGHRLWIAPENMPNSYTPDNDPVQYFYDEINNSIKLIQPVETISQTQKEMTVSLDKQGSGVNVHHKITNLGDTEIELAAWALTIMREGGEVLVPNETYRQYGAETLLPVRNLTVWSYTDFSDPRWRFDREFIHLRVDAERTEPQKIGVLNKKGWAKYLVGDFEFTKTFAYDESKIYPDMNSNMEIYTAGDFVEIESLAPLCRLKKGESTEHLETWNLAKSTK